MTLSPNLAQLAAQGVSVWLDDLNRQRLTSGTLKTAVDLREVVGVTTNPSIFQAALASSDDYTDAVNDLARRGSSVDNAVFELTTSDVREACDVLRPVYDATQGRDGRVSIEVDPRLAQDTKKTVASAKELFAAVGRPNVMIKIPATIEGLPAISQVLAEGISVNVTLIFSLDRYRAVMNAFLTGIEQARERGHDLRSIHSVASFFVSRMDTEIDKRLDALAADSGIDIRALRGRAGIANARLAYQAFDEVFSTPRWASLAAEGAPPQRPLWASTGVKDPAYPDTMYVTELVAPHTVNTMPEKTLRAVADHGQITGDTVTGHYEESERLLDELERLGISYTDVTALLEKEGVEKFEKAWNELLAGVSTELKKASA